MQNHNVLRVMCWTHPSGLNKPIHCELFKLPHPKLLDEGFQPLYIFCQKQDYNQVVVFFQ